MNCTVEVRPGGAEIWGASAGTSAATGSGCASARAQGARSGRTRPCSGGFGRRSNPDFALEAGGGVAGRGCSGEGHMGPRDDCGHDWYRPASLHRLVGGLDSGGRVVAWTHRGSLAFHPDAEHGPAVLRTGDHRMWSPVPSITYSFLAANGSGLRARAHGRAGVLLALRVRVADGIRERELRRRAGRRGRARSGGAAPRAARARPPALQRWCGSQPSSRAGAHRSRKGTGGAWPATSIRGRALPRWPRCRW